MCTRAVGNLALERLWVHFIQAKVFFLEPERREEAVHFEELRRAQEMVEYFDLVNSPPETTSKTSSEEVQR